MYAGLSGLAAATTLAKAGIEVHVHDVRENSGQRFDGDFQALENWSMDADFFDQLTEWGYDPSEFKATEFKEVDLIHPDDEISKPTLQRSLTESWRGELLNTQSIKVSSEWLLQLALIYITRAKSKKMTARLSLVVLRVQVLLMRFSRPSIQITSLSR